MPDYLGLDDLLDRGIYPEVARMLLAQSDHYGNDRQPVIPATELEDRLALVLRDLERGPA